MLIDLFYNHGSFYEYQVNNSEYRVQDVNDFAPKFMANQSHANVSEKSAYGTEVFKVSVLRATLISRLRKRRTKRDRKPWQVVVTAITAWVDKTTVDQIRLVHLPLLDESSCLSILMK